LPLISLFVRKKIKTKKGNVLSMGKVNRGKTKLAEICFLPKNVCTYLLYGLRIDLRGSLCT